MKAETKKQGKAAVIAVLGVGFCALFNALFSDTQSQWYTALKKPVYMPPPLVFSCAWIAVYLLLTVALQRQIHRINKGAVYGFVAILTLVALWNYAFFMLQNNLAALILLVFCVLTAGYTIRQTWQKDVLTTILLFFIAGWITFVCVFQFYIYMMN